MERNVQAPRQFQQRLIIRAPFVPAAQPLYRRSPYVAANTQLGVGALEPALLLREELS